MSATPLFFGYQPPFNIPLLEVNISILEPERWTIVCISSPCSDYLFACISRLRGKDRRDLEADGNRDRSIWSLSTHRIQNKTATDSGYEEVDQQSLTTSHSIVGQRAVSTPSNETCCTHIVIQNRHFNIHYRCIDVHRIRTSSDKMLINIIHTGHSIPQIPKL